ncbi:MAG: prepilin-type N-terminal cleavage/methylation domain-containing protein [Clostridia bacterium]|nr:prepilin-type N-terminal cleavage/methylation domain-containing protein [Clostridia bacterium]
MKILSKNKKGFTLIEIVIVIVIIAILAAILVPQITKWIDKSRIATLKSEADTIRLSVVSAVDHEYADTVNDATITSADVSAEFWSELSKMANRDLSTDNLSFTITKGAITNLEYTKGNHTATYDGTDWTYE